MGGFGGEPRIAASELDLDRSLRRRGAVRAERFDRTRNTWVEIGTFGSGADASARIDAEIAAGRVAASDVRVSPVPNRWRWLVVGLLAVLIVLVVAAWVAIAT